SATPAFAQGTPAPAAQDDQEIVVTATKREVNLQDVPFSINAQTQQQIQRSGATTIEDLSRNVAGLQIQNLGPGQSQVAVRGVATRYITNHPVLSRTGGSVEGNLNVLDGGDFGGALRGMVNVPVSDQVALRAVGYYTQYGGFIDAVGPAGGENVNDGHRVGGR